MSPIRLLVIGHSFVTARSRALFREVAREGGFEVTVAAPNSFHGEVRRLQLEPEPDGSPLQLTGLDVHGTRFETLFGYQDEQLRALLPDGRFDLVHASEEPFTRAAAQIARAVGNTFARFCFRTAESPPRWNAPPYRGYTRTTLSRAQGWLVAGEAQKRALVARGFPEAKARVLPLAVDPSAYRPFDEPERARVRDELALHPPVIGYVGNFSREKGIPVLLSALERLGTDRPWSMLFIGTGPLEPMIRAWVRDRWINDRVRILWVRQHELPRYLPAIDVLVVPNQTARKWRERSARMLVEAFASGVPVIASDVAELPFVLGDAGRVVAEADSAGYAREIARFLDDPATRSEQVRRGFARVEAFSVARLATGYRDFYRWLADQPLT